MRLPVCLPSTLQPTRSGLGRVLKLPADTVGFTLNASPRAGQHRLESDISLYVFFFFFEVKFRYSDILKS